jgi:hypothetical protein
VEDISLHVLDIAENSLRAGATKMKLSSPGPRRNLLRVEVVDDGRGMDTAILARSGTLLHTKHKKQAWESFLPRRRNRQAAR